MLPNQSNRKKPFVIAILVISLFAISLIIYSVERIRRSNIASTQSEASSGKIIETWVWWSPIRATPKTSYPTIWQDWGGGEFMKYEHDEDFVYLKGEFDQMIAYSKPHYLVISLENTDIIPLITTNLPIGNNQAKEGVMFNYDFDYHKDLIELCRQNGIKVILYPSSSVSGGQFMYPFSYYVGYGWFWQRPDWGPSNLSAEEKRNQGYGYADPRSEAMFYPPEAPDNWVEHQANYTFYDPSGQQKHKQLTSDNFEFSGLASPQDKFAVYEDPRMVFNALSMHYNTNPPIEIHYPLPSLSSIGFGKFNSELYSRIANEFKDNTAVVGYYLYQEPGYHLLKENTRLIDKQDSQVYDVDYSFTELVNYNNWRATKNLQPVSRVPYPQDNDYIEFKYQNLANFEAMLANSLKTPNPSKFIIMPVFYEKKMTDATTANNADVLASTVKPDILSIEHPRAFFEQFVESQNRGSWDSYVANFKAKNPNLKNVFFSYNLINTAIDETIAGSFDIIIVPAFNGGDGVANSQTDYGYPLWYGGGKCIDHCGSPRYPNIVNNNTCQTLNNCNSTNMPVSTNTILPSSTSVTTTKLPDCGSLDYNHDNKIDILDFGSFKTNYNEGCDNRNNQNTKCGPKDTNLDGKIDIVDFKEFIEKYHEESC